MPGVEISGSSICEMQKDIVSELTLTKLSKFHSQICGTKSNFTWNWCFHAQIPRQTYEVKYDLDQVMVRPIFLWNHLKSIIRQSEFTWNQNWQLQSNENCKLDKELEDTLGNFKTFPPRVHDFLAKIPSKYFFTKGLYYKLISRKFFEVGVNSPNFHTALWRNSQSVRFYVKPILGEFEDYKTAVIDILGALNFIHLVNFSLQNCKNS